MAYDPEDKNDQKIVKKLIDEALAAQESDLTTAHENNIKGLKTKNGELLKQIRDAKQFDPEQLSQLEEKLADSQSKLTKAEKALEKLNQTKTELETGLAAEKTYGENLLKENGLTAALASVKVADTFQPAVKALLGSKVGVKVEGDTRTLVVGDKSLTDYVKEWSQGDEGKHFISADLNGGTGAKGSGGKAPGGKVVSRSQFDQMQPEARSTFFREGGTLSEG